MDWSGNVRSTPSIAINPSTGAPAIAYLLYFKDRYAGHLNMRYAYLQGDTWTREVADWIPDAGHHPSAGPGRTWILHLRNGIPIIVYNNGTGSLMLVHTVRSGNGIWATTLADKGIGRNSGDAGNAPQFRITDSGMYIAHRDGHTYGSLRFTRKPTNGTGRTLR